MPNPARRPVPGTATARHTTSAVPESGKVAAALILRIVWIERSVFLLAIFLSGTG